MKIAIDARCGPGAGPAAPEWLFTGMSRSAHVGPDRVVVRVAKSGGRSESGGTPGRRIPPNSPCSARPLDLGHRVVDVVQEDLRHARAATRRIGAEVGQPPVVGLQPRPAQLVLVVLGRSGEEVARREERRDRVGEDHLGDDAVVLELLQARLRVPVAIRGLAPEVDERVHVRLRPLVELVEVASPRGTRGTRASAAPAWPSDDTTM